MMSTLPTLRTTKIMAQELGLSEGQLRELLRQHPEVRAAARAGRALIFTKEALAEIKAVLQRRPSGQRPIP